VAHANARTTFNARKLMVDRRAAGWRPALGLVTSTVGRILARHGVPALAAIDAITGLPARRWHPGIRFRRLAKTLSGGSHGSAPTTSSGRGAHLAGPAALRARGRSGMPGARSPNARTGASGRPCSGRPSADRPGWNHHRTGPVSGTPVRWWGVTG
jgi:hypothetical protein